MYTVPVPMSLFSDVPNSVAPSDNLFNVAIHPSPRSATSRGPLDTGNIKKHVIAHLHTTQQNTQAILPPYEDTHANTGRLFIVFPYRADSRGTSSGYHSPRTKGVVSPISKFAYTSTYSDRVIFIATRDD